MPIAEAYVLVRLPQSGRTALLERVATLFRTEDVEGWHGCIVTATSLVRFASGARSGVNDGGQVARAVLGDANDRVRGV